MIHRYPRLILKLKNKDARIDLSGYIIENISGFLSQYLGELSGYIIKDARHFASCIRR
jgi:hypothetical protein